MKYQWIVLLFAICVVACQSPSPSKWTSVKYIMGKPSLVNLNLGDTAQSIGDILSYEATLSDTSGNIVGEVMGENITIDVVEGDSLNPINSVERTGMVIFNFGNENEIIVDGMNSAYKGEVKMKMGVTQLRPIIGGTGIYKGIKGQLFATPTENGTYSLVFEMKN
jgi:hypothetical protein